MQWLLHTSRSLETLHQWKIYWSNQLELGRWRQKHPSTSQHLISLSSPTALLGFKDLRALRTKFTLILSRWNSKRRVKWFCQYSPHGDKVLVHDLGDREIFGVLLPIFKDWKNSRLFSTRQYLFYCAPHFPGITLKEIFQKRVKEFQKHLRERGCPQNSLSLSRSLKYTLKKRKRHFNKNLQEGKTFCRLSRKINHQFLAIKAFSWNTGNS